MPLCVRILSSNSSEYDNLNKIEWDETLNETETIKQYYGVKSIVNQIGYK